MKFQVSLAPELRWIIHRKTLVEDRKDLAAVLSPAFVVLDGRNLAPYRRQFELLAALLILIPGQGP